MTEQPAPRGDRLTMPQISGAVTGLGWRYLLGMLRTAIPVRSLAEAAGVAAQVVAAAGAGGDRHLWLDLRPDQVIVTLQTHAAATVTARDVAIAGQLTAALGARGLPTDPDPPGARRVGAVTGGRDRRAGHAEHNEACITTWQGRG